MAGHGHGHAPTATGRHRRRLLAVLLLTLAVAAVQVVGGLLSGSLALLADAGHMLTDATGVGVALLAATLASRPPTDARTFGLQRAEILAALANGLLLLGLGVWVVVEALRRWSDPPEVATGLMLAVALVGAAANVVGLLLLHGGRHESLNVRGAYLEVAADLLGSVAVVVAAVVILLTGWTRADVVASVVIGAVVVPRAALLLRDVVDVLLESTPRGLDLQQVRDHIGRVDGVVEVHDLHAWTITSGAPALSAHVVVDAACLAHDRSGEVLDRLAACLVEHFAVEHCTFQLEPVGHREHEGAHHD